MSYTHNFLKLSLVAGLFFVPIMLFASTIERVSLSSVGVEGNGNNSGLPFVTPDGRYVAFNSNSTNLVAGDTNAKGDIFVYDRDTDTIERVSVDDAGVEGNNDSSVPSLSADGRYVVFTSSATNLVAGDTNAKTDVFVYDRDTDTIERVSVDDAGVEGNDSANADVAISNDGRYVAFSSLATNLVAGDTNAVSDVFVYDRDSDTIERVSVTDGGVEGNALAIVPSLSADGRYVSFSSVATNLVAGDTNAVRDIFVYDRDTNTIERVSVDDAGVEGNGAVGTDASISSNGRFIAFNSAATNLVAGDTNAKIDMFVHDRETDTTERVSLSSAGVEGNNNSQGKNHVISTDGRYIAFDSTASNLVAGDTNGTYDIFVYDRTLDTIQLISQSDAGVVGNSLSLTESLSPNGRYIAFLSLASNLVTGDGNGVGDEFFVDRGPTITVSVTVTNDNGGVLTADDFDLLLDGDAITADVAATTTAGTYTVSLVDDNDYTATFDGDCDSDGEITMEFGNAYTCGVTVDDNEPEPEEAESGGGHHSSSSHRSSSPNPGLSSGLTPTMTGQNLTPEEREQLISEIKVKLTTLIQELIKILQAQIAEIVAQQAE